jgi:hypothetical protein
MQQRDLGSILDGLWLRYRDSIWQYFRPFLINVFKEVLRDPHAWSGTADREPTAEDHELAAAWVSRHTQKQAKR